MSLLRTVRGVRRMSTWVRTTALKRINMDVVVTIDMSLTGEKVSLKEAHFVEVLGGGLVERVHELTFEHPVAAAAWVCSATHGRDKDTLLASKHETVFITR